MKHALATTALALGFGTVLTLWLTIFFAKSTSDVDMPDPFYMSDDEAEWEIELWEAKK